MEKNRVRIQIGLKHYTLTGTESEASLYRIAAYVDRKMKEISEAAPSLSTTDVATLAAVNMADELLRLKDEQSEMHERLNRILNEQEAAGESAQPSEKESANR